MPGFVVRFLVDWIVGEFGHLGHPNEPASLFPRFLPSSPSSRSDQ